MTQNTTNVTLKLPAQALKAAVEVSPAEEAAASIEKAFIADSPVAVLEKVLLEPVKDLPPVEPTAVAYPKLRAGRLTQFILHDGTVVKPVNGVYVADTQEKFEMLCYYFKQNAGLVFDDLDD